MMSRFAHRALCIAAALGFLAPFGCDSMVIVHHRHPAPAPAVVKGPPAWAPAHGHRAKCRYYYYPSAAVYFDMSRGVYFYYTAGVWRTSATLPASFTIEVGERVTLELETSRPYEFHKETARRYPPGQAKKMATRRIK